MNPDALSSRRFTYAALLTVAAFMVAGFAWAIFVAARGPALNAYVSWYMAPDFTLYVPASDGIGRFLWVYQLPFAAAALLAAGVLRTSVQWRPPGGMIVPLVAPLAFLAAIGTVAAVNDWTGDYFTQLFAIVTTPMAFAVLIYARFTTAGDDSESGPAAKAANVAAAVVALIGLGLALYSLVVDFDASFIPLSVLILTWYLAIVVALASEYARLTENDVLAMRLAAGAVALVVVIVIAGFWLIQENQDRGISYTFAQTIWTLLNITLLPAVLLAAPIAWGLGRAMLPMFIAAVIGVLSLVFGYHVATGPGGTTAGSAGILLTLLPLAAAIFFSGLPDGDTVYESDDREPGAFAPGEPPRNADE